MKRLLISLVYYVIPIITISQVLLISCSKEDNSKVDATTSDFTVYKNLTGDVNADALQAQYKDSQTTLNFYGLFNQDKNPTTIKTLTYQKANNDTIVNLIIDPLNYRLASSYYTVKGVKSSVVMKFDYIDNSGLNVSFYNYDWGNNTSEIIYSAYLFYGIINAGKNSFYYNSSSFSDISHKAGVDGFGLGVGALGAGLVFAEIVGTIGGGFTLIGALSAAGAAIAASGTAVAIATGLAIGAAILIINDAAAEELIPSNLSQPTNTPIDNPVSQENNPRSNLEPSDCKGSNITFEASMDAFGSIGFSGIEGGVGPYSFGVGSTIQHTEVFPNKYIDGSYLVSVKDANGCISAKIVHLRREINCTTTTLAVTTTTTSTSATANPTGGMSPYTYLWSNGNTSATVTDLTPGTYTVNVTDNHGCLRTADAIISSSLDFSGTWNLEILTETCFSDVPFTIPLTFDQNLKTISMLLYDINQPNPPFSYSIEGNNLLVNDTRPALLVPCPESNHTYTTIIDVSYLSENLFVGTFTFISPENLLAEGQTGCSLEGSNCTVNIRIYK